MSWENLFKDLRIGRIAEAYPLNYLDIGTRDGFQDDLSALAFAVHAIGFEPEPTEFARLSNAGPGPWVSRRILPFAISPAGGSAVLHVSNDRNGASLLLPLPAFGLPPSRHCFSQHASTPHQGSRASVHLYELA